MVYNPQSPNVYEDEEEIEHYFWELGLGTCGGRVATERKRILVVLKGGRCAECGYSKTLSGLDFHHPDPETKEYSVSWAIRNFTSKQFEEVLIPHVLDATKLLCATCHREETHSRKVS